jgi:hypothetical protein
MELDGNRFARFVLEDEGSTLVLEWTAATTEMGDDGFQDGLARFAALAVEHRPAHLLVDVRSFGYRSDTDFGPWRDAEIIPRYNAAGVTKFAFLLPGEPPPKAPAPEGPATFPTGYFALREAIDAWFATE